MQNHRAFSTFRVCQESWEPSGGLQVSGGRLLYLSRMVQNRNGTDQKALWRTSEAVGETNDIKSIAEVGNMPLVRARVCRMEN